MSVKTVMFLCTGNYYRSRFAEELFNHWAGHLRLGWRACSRGLGVDPAGTINLGPIAQVALDALSQRCIPIAQPIRYPKAVISEDFTSANWVIALKEAEHRPLLRQHFMAWESRVTYWHVHDLDQAPALIALPQIETLVRDLIDRLAKPAWHPARVTPKVS